MTQINYKPTQVLDMFPDKDDLLYYLRMKFKNPSIELHVDKNNKVIGFICVDINGIIFTTFNTPGKIEFHNDNDNSVQSALKDTLLSQLSSKLSAAEKSVFYLKVAFFAALFFAILFFFQNEKNRDPDMTKFHQYQDSLNDADTTIYWTEKDTVTLPLHVN